LSGLCYGQGADLPEAPVFPIPVPWLLYVDTSDKEVTFGWDGVSDARLTGYEMVFYNMERRAWLYRANIPVPQTTFKVKFKGGHWIAYIRTVGKEADNTAIHSVWGSSISPEIAAEGKPFWIFLMPAPPGQLEVN